MLSRFQLFEDRRRMGIEVATVIQPEPGDEVVPDHAPQTVPHNHNALILTRPVQVPQQAQAFCANLLA
jgi:hypothetical protein